MKKLVLTAIVAFTQGFTLPQNARSQGTVYLSSLGPSAGTELVGSDAWVAANFRSGNSPGGYVLDSVELDMASATGNPSGFEIQLYNMTDMGSPLPVEPGTSIASFSGTGDPTSAGLYTFTASGVTLTPDTQYAIVVTAMTSIASGSFAWGLENPSSNTSIGGWTEGGVTYESSDGSTWSANTIYDPEFSLTATAVPEPDTLGMLGLTGLLFFTWHHWQAKARPRIPN